MRSHATASGHHRSVPIVLQKSFCVAPRKRAQNTIPGDDLMANEDSLDEPRCRMGFYPSCLLSDIRSTFATKSAKSRLMHRNRAASASTIRIERLFRPGTVEQ